MENTEKCDYSDRLFRVRDDSSDWFRWSCDHRLPACCPSGSKFSWQLNLRTSGEEGVSLPLSVIPLPNPLPKGEDILLIPHSRSTKILVAPLRLAYYGRLTVAFETSLTERSIIDVRSYLSFLCAFVSWTRTGKSNAHPTRSASSIDTCRAAQRIWYEREFGGNLHKS